MKKLLAIFLAALMALTGAALAEETQNEGLYDELVVGSTTALSGSFFTEMWGDNTSDIDVRMLLHGYNLMEWKSALGSYGLDERVVTGMVVTDDYLGNRTYTLALSRDLTYSDGTPITARDYAFSILLSAAPEIAAIGGETTASDAILGAADYKSGAAQALAGVRVLGDYSLAVTVSAEYQPFFYELALLNYCPYPIHVIAPGCEVADDGEGAYIRNADSTVEEPIFTAELLETTILDPETGYLSHPSVVSGPYVLSSFDWDTRTAVFKINEQYKGNSAGETPTIPRIVFRTVSPDTMIDELANGEVDLLHKCVQADVIDAGLALTGEDAGYSATNYARSGYSFISFNCERPATGSQAVRQAIAHCLDKDALVSGYVRNYGVAVDGYYGIGQWIYQLVNGAIGAPVEPLAEDASEEETAAYEAELAEWDALSLDGVATYALDLDAAAALLEGDGWTLNREGEAFDPAADDVRCKEIDGELVALELTMIYPEGNAIGDALQAAFVDNLAQVGVALAVEPVETTELLDIYYRNVERDCDMIYLATNFSVVFEPSSTFNPDDAYQGAYNRTAIADDELYERAVDMYRTEPGDTLAYLQKWVAFQERFAEVLPTIPVYSNMYFDFYTSTLQNYNVSEYLTWSQAIVGAYLSDVVQEVPAEEAEPAPAEEAAPAEETEPASAE